MDNTPNDPYVMQTPFGQGPELESLKVQMPSEPATDDPEVWYGGQRLPVTRLNEKTWRVSVPYAPGVTVEHEIACVDEEIEYSKHTISRLD